jgi:hypothetical protein
LPAGNGDGERIDRLLALIPGEDDRLWLSTRVESKWLARRRRLAARDAAICEVARLLGPFDSGRAAALVVNRRITRYVAAGWRFERNLDEAPADPLRGAMHRVLSRGGGRVPTARQLRRILAGLGQNRPSKWPTGTGKVCCENHTLETDEGKGTEAGTAEGPSGTADGSRNCG